MNITTTRYYNDVYEYLSKKFPDIPAPLILEAAAYIAHRMIVAVSDAVWKRDELWRDEMRIIHNKYTPIRRRSENKGQSVSQGEFDKSWGE